MSRQLKSKSTVYCRLDAHYGTQVIKRSEKGERERDTHTQGEKRERKWNLFFLL